MVSIFRIYCAQTDTLLLGMRALSTCMTHLLVQKQVTLYHMHDTFPCTEISYTLSSGEIRIFTRMFHQANILASVTCISGWRLCLDVPMDCISVMKEAVSVLQWYVMPKGLYLWRMNTSVMPQCVVSIMFAQTKLSECRNRMQHWSHDCLSGCFQTFVNTNFTQAKWKRVKVFSMSRKCNFC